MAGSWATEQQWELRKCRIHLWGREGFPSKGNPLNFLVWVLMESVRDWTKAEVVAMGFLAILSYHEMVNGGQALCMAPWLNHRGDCELLIHCPSRWDWFQSPFVHSCFMFCRVQALFAMSYWQSLGCLHSHGSCEEAAFVLKFFVTWGGVVFAIFNIQNCCQQW